MSGATNEPHFQRPKGWVLKTIKRAQRIQGKVKIYLTEKFNEGVRTGNTADPAQVAHEIRHEKDSSQNLEFLPSEWRSQRQVANFFGRLSSLQRHTELITPSGVSELDEDMWEEENNRREVRRAVYDVLDIGHPLIYQDQDLCSLAKKHKLSKFKLKELEEICSEFEVEPVGTKLRKATFIKPLQVFIEQCSCSKEN